MLGQETNGAGGIFKAFRTIPVILSIVEDMKELCPNAWLVNFTNPSGMVTEAVMKYGKWDRVIGLCNVPVGAMMAEPETIGTTLDKLIYKFAGLNHFHWHRVFDLDGTDVTGKIIDAMYEGKDSGIPANIHDIPFFKEQLKQMNQQEINSLILPIEYPLVHFGKAVMSPELGKKFTDGWHIGMYECRIERQPEFQTSEFPLEIRPEYRQAYNMYREDNESPTGETFLGVAFYHKQ